MSESNEQSVAWKRQAEGGSLWLLKAYVWFMTTLGRPIARIVLAIITVYFFVVRGAERLASRQFMARVLDRAPRHTDVFKHFWYFSNATMDRVFFLVRKKLPLELRQTNLEMALKHIDSDSGALLLGAHLGSFEACRILSELRPEAGLKIVMDRQRGSKINGILEGLNPTFASQILDVSERSAVSMLKIKETLDDGHVVGMLADRFDHGTRAIPATFLGDQIALPQAPFLMAVMAGCPVILAFGYFRGGKLYEVVFEELYDGTPIARQDRQRMMAELAQRYADRLAEHAAANPYNWFNFYDFWDVSTARIESS